MPPIDPQEFAQMKKDLEDLKELRDILLGIRFPSFWHFILPVLIDRLRLPNLSADPATAVAGELAVVSGKLKVYDGSAWTIVGTQT